MSQQERSHQASSPQTSHKLSLEKDRSTSALSFRFPEKLGLKRRNFIKLSLVSLGLSLPHVFQSVRQKDKAEAVAWMKGIITAIELISDVFGIYEKITGFFSARNDTDEVQTGDIDFDIFDVESGELEVSDRQHFTLQPGMNRDCPIACSGCATPGRKKLRIYTEDGYSESYYFDVV